LLVTVNDGAVEAAAAHLALTNPVQQLLVGLCQVLHGQHTVGSIVAKQLRNVLWAAAAQKLHGRCLNLHTVLHNQHSTLSLAQSQLR